MISLKNIVIHFQTIPLILKNVPRLSSRWQDRLRHHWMSQDNVVVSFGIAPHILVQYISYFMTLGLIENFLSLNQ